jgi:hypothetical protein
MDGQEKSPQRAANNAAGLDIAPFASPERE